ncbi:hypothetical protein [Aggregatibacter actinomycetemcomitans]|uniref:hypothetical protein n=1 Tax=Aggregatibacter actinomycetemcomitans TaxID=714 RepID=UPI002150A3A5|nr:hypothetical protein [Aggregatibacter actinomycetemcomitans]
MNIKTTPDLLRAGAFLVKLQSQMLYCLSIKKAETFLVTYCRCATVHFQPAGVGFLFARQ